MGGVTESMAIYRRQLRVLAVALIAAVSCLALAWYASGQPRPPAEKEPANVSHATEEALLVPQPAILAATKESLAEEVKPRPASTGDSSAPEKPPKQDQIHQVASSTKNTAEALSEGEDESSKEDLSSGAAGRLRRADATISWSWWTSSGPFLSITRRAT